MIVARLVVLTSLGEEGESLVHKEDGMSLLPLSLERRQGGLEDALLSSELRFFTDFVSLLSPRLSWEAQDVRRPSNRSLLKTYVARGKTGEVFRLAVAVRLPSLFERLRFRLLGF